MSSRIVKPLAAATACCLALAGCVPPPAPAPAPVATPTPTPKPAPRPTLTPAPENWMDAPRTPGDWTYVQSGTRSHAAYGPANSEAEFVIGCDKATRTIHLVRAGPAQGSIPMRILTETADRMLSAQASHDGFAVVTATLPANDRLLDAMAFSKGRFAVEVPGLETLYLPSWAEVSRVIEDCR